MYNQKVGFSKAQKSKEIYLKKAQNEKSKTFYDNYNKFRDEHIENVKKIYSQTIFQYYNHASSGNSQVAKNQAKFENA